FLWRQEDEAQCSIVRYVCVRGENVNSIEISAAPRELPEHVRKFAAHFVLLVETSFAVFHLPAEVRSGIEPESCRVMRLIAGSIEIVQAVRETTERVDIDRRRLVW